MAAALREFFWNMIDLLWVFASEGIYRRKGGARG
jgi:hypothetical protein